MKINYRRVSVSIFATLLIGHSATAHASAPLSLPSPSGSVDNSTLSSSFKIAPYGCTPEDAKSGRCGPTDGDIRTRMDQCINGSISPNDVIGSPMGPRLFMTCGAYRHINDRHNANADKEHFLICLSNVNSKGGLQDAKNPLEKHKSWKNKKSNVWGNIIFDPFRESITTAFTSGDGKDWGGCAR